MALASNLYIQFIMIYKEAVKMWIRFPNLKGVLFVVLQPVVQQHTQRHDAAVKFAILGCPVGVNDDCGLIWENVTPFPTLTLQLLLTLTFLFLKVNTDLI